MKLKNKIKVAIDSPAAAGAGTQAKLISKHFNLFYLDTGKIYRLIANIKLTQPKKYTHALIKKTMKKLNMKNLQDKSLLSDEVGTMASIISKDKLAVAKLLKSIMSVAVIVELQLPGGVVVPKIKPLV